MPSKKQESMLNNINKDNYLTENNKLIEFENKNKNKDKNF
jgi:hypothetical protein